RAAHGRRLRPAPASRRHAAETLVDALVALHAVDIDAVGLGDYAKREGYLDRQLRRWSTQWAASKTRELPAMERLHAWLVEHRPAEPETWVGHGDIRLGNALHAPDGTTLALLDWELSTLGDPLADVSYLLRSWATPGEAAPRRGRGPPGRGGGLPRPERPRRPVRRGVGPVPRRSRLLDGAERLALGGDRRGRLAPPHRGQGG